MRDDGAACSVANDAEKGGDTRHEENKTVVSPDDQLWVGTDRCSKHRSRPSTLSLVHGRSSGYFVAIPDGSGRFRIRATCCASREERREIQTIGGKWHERERIVSAKEAGSVG